MDTLILFGATLLGLFLAFRTCDGLVQQIGTNDTPIDLRSGVLGAVAVLGLWMLTDLAGWAWSPRAIQALLHAATPVELNIVSMWWSVGLCCQDSRSASWPPVSGRC